MTHSDTSDDQGLIATELCVERGGTPILNRVSIRIPSGSAVWLDGPSGAGKTSLLQALARLIPTCGGDLKLNGASHARFSAPAWRRRVLFVPHPPVALAETVERELLTPFALGQHRATRAPGPTTLRRELEQLDLGQLPLTRSTAGLSQGQLARLVLIRALLTQPDVLLLDEPTANLDPSSEERTRRRLQAYCTAGGAVLVAAHATPWTFVTHHYRIRRGSVEQAIP